MGLRPPRRRPSGARPCPRARMRIPAPRLASPRLLSTGCWKHQFRLPNWAFNARTSSARGGSLVDQAYA
eukprot:1035649-Pyramimonas_sp.AAC.1